MTRWGVLQSPIYATPEKVEKIVLACTALHNYLRQTDSARYTLSGFIDSEDSTGTIKKELLGQESIRVLMLIQERLWQNILFLKKVLCHGS